MKKNIYNLLSGTKCGLFALALAVCPGRAFSQTTYTFNYTGSTQTISLPAGSYSIQCWGADGGNATNGTNSTFGGKGGYARGTYSNASTATFSVYVGGHGGNASGSAVGGGGGGMSDIAGPGGIIIAAGGGGGGTSSGTSSEISGGGDGGGLVGGTAKDNTGVSTGTAASGGSQTAGGIAQAGSYGAGSPGGFGYGGGGANGGVAGVLHGSGGSGGNGGTGGWNGGGGGSTATGINDNSGGGGAGYYGGGGGRGDGGAGGGGSSYIAALTSATTIMVGQTGFVTNPNSLGNGYVLITELCNISLLANGVTGNGTICSGDSISLTTNAVSNFSWSTGATSSSIVVAPTTNTVYMLTATSSSNCVASAQVVITVNNGLPNITVANTASATGGICPTNTVALTASGAITYTWTGGTAVTNGVPFAPTSTSGYTVTGENACGTGTAATSVSIHPQPTITAAPTQPSVCTQQSVAICVNGGVNYTITPTQQNCVAFFPFATQVYTVVGENSVGCRSSVTTTVEVETTPATPPLSSHSLICTGSSATLNAIGATDYTWTPGTFSTSAIVVSPNTTTTYTITKRNANCYDTQTIALIVNPLPTAFAVAQPTVVCAGSSATLSGCCGNSYTWSPGNLPSGPGAANISVYPQADTEYTMAVSDGTCVNTSTVALATYTNPIISITTNTDYLCAGQTVNFNISGADNYTFTSNPSTSPPLTGATAAVQLTTTTNYMITGSNSSSCTSSAQKVIVVYPLPNFALSSTPGLVCVGGAANLSAASSATSPAHQYVWAHNQQTGSSTVVNPMTTTTYSATGTNTVTGCVSDKTVSVAVFEPTFVTTSDTAICNKGSVNLIASGATSFTWTGGQPGIHFITVSPSVTTIYSVTALSQTVNGLKCLSTQTVEVSIYNNPTITATHQRSVVCRGESVELYAKGADTYTWTNAGNKNGDTISVSPLNKTTYIVIGTDMFGCRDTSDVTVEFSNCTGFAEYQGRLDVSIFPNPSSGAFTIQGAEDMDLELLNELGQVIRVIRLTGNNQHTVNVAEVAAGVYFLRGKQQETVVTEKVVVQR